MVRDAIELERSPRRVRGHDTPRLAHDLDAIGEPYLKQNRQSVRQSLSKTVIQENTLCREDSQSVIQSDRKTLCWKGSQLVRQSVGERVNR